jgi:CcmD family protein
MYELLNQNQLFIVLTVILTIWFGIIWYLARLEKKIKKLESHIKKVD